MRPLIITLALLVPTLVSPVARSQDAPDPQAARESASRTLDCIERVNHDLQNATRQLRDAARQTRSSDARARSDAARAVVSLQQRVSDLSRALKACVPEEAQLRTQTVVREPTGSDSSVGQANDIPAVEQNAQLAPNVFAVIGQRVDGTGRLDDAVVKRGIRAAAGRFERCYQQLVNRGALQSGQLNLIFSITDRRTIQRVRVEHSTIADQRFNRCVKFSGRQISPGPGPTGGEVRYSYTLRFGPSR